MATIRFTTTPCELGKHDEIKYIKLKDHQDEIERLKNVNKALQSQLTEAEKYKPNEGSFFAIRYTFQAHEGSIPELKMVYANEYKHMIPLLNRLNQNKSITNIRVYALNEVEISHEITIKLPE